MGQNTATDKRGVKNIVLYIKLYIITQCTYKHKVVKIILNNYYGHTRAILCENNFEQSIET